MKRSVALIVTSLIIASACLPAVGNPAQGQGRDQPASSLATGQIVLVARDLIDLKWDPTNYPHPEMPFRRWEIWRGLSSSSLNDRVRVGFDQETGFYRDEELALDTTYYYRLSVVRWDAQKEEEVVFRFFDDNEITGVLQGVVHEDLVLGSGVYEIGKELRGTYASGVGVMVIDDATLSIDQGTTVLRPDSGRAFTICASYGRLEVDGATFDGIDLRFGDPDDEDSWGDGWVQNAKGADVEVYGESEDILILKNSEGSATVGSSASAVVQDNTGLWSVFVHDAGSAVVDHNTISNTITVQEQAEATIVNNPQIGGIEVKGSAGATISNNTITGQVNVTGYGAPLETKASATIISNTITLESQHKGVDVGRGAQATVAYNKIEWTGFHGSESSVLLWAWGGEGTKLVARGNHIIHGKLVVSDGAEVDIQENVLHGGGAAITIGCVVCGTETQATGQIMYNTVQQGWGFEMWAGSEKVSVKHNCIRGNDPGLTIDDDWLAQPLDFEYNWWNSDSGPHHPAKNPGGHGDSIDGNKVDFEPWDDTDRYCADLPPGPPPPEPAMLFMEADPEELMPDGQATAWVYAKLRDDVGGAVVGAEISFSLSPDLGQLVSEKCTTDHSGQCRVAYRAPGPTEVKGADKVTVEARADGLSEMADIEFIYLKVERSLPVNGTRNLDWEAATVYAIFDREINAATVTPGSFKVTSSFHYRDGLSCQYDASAAKHVFCLLEDLKDLTKYPNADKGLVITSELKSGPDGIRSVDGAFLQRNYLWKIFTTPKLAPRVIPVQVAEGADLIALRPTVVRVHAGLHEDTELDWVQADVDLIYDGGQSFTKAAYTFYPGELGVEKVKLQGNSANFYSRLGQVPIIGSKGSHTAAATVTPVDQIGHPPGEPRKGTASANAKVRNIAYEAYVFRYQVFPITPSFHDPYWTVPYRWKPDDRLPDLKHSNIVLGSKPVAENLLPLNDVDRRFWSYVVEARSPYEKITWPRYMAAWVRMLDRNFGRIIGTDVRQTQVQVLLVPKEWMAEANGNDPLWQGPSSYVCLMSEDASPVAFAHCVGNLYGLSDDEWGWPSPRAAILKGYNLVRDRVVDNERLDELGTEHSVPLMHRGIGYRLPEEVWIDRDNYQELVNEFGSSLLAPRSLSTAPEAVALTVGGEVVQENSEETGLLDIAEMPAVGVPFPQPDGSGEYGLRLRDSGGTILATHAFTPEFFDLEEGVHYATFLYTLSAPDTTQKVELLHGSSVLSTLEASANPPTVSLNKPAPGSHSGLVQVAWSATDPDGTAELHFSVLHSSDNGLTWEPVTLHTIGAGLFLDTSAYANCTQCRVKVVADDGFHSAEAQSAAFSVTNPPQVDWVWPSDGATDAGIYTEVQAVFRDAMEAGRITASTFTLTDMFGDAVAGTVAYNPDIRQAMFTPSQALTHNVSYTARLSASLQDAAGQSLGSEVAWTFRVEGGLPGVFMPLVFCSR